MLIPERKQQGEWYTFTERCEEILDLRLDDGTTKIFLNMTSKNGDPVLVSLLQYMKKTRLDNSEIIVDDGRLTRLDEAVTEVKQSEEWEAVKMSILSVGIEYGEKKGFERGDKLGFERGNKLGFERGEYDKLCQLVQKKLKKGKLPSVIADELEEEPSVIEKIIREIDDRET